MYCTTPSDRAAAAQDAATIPCNTTKSGVVKKYVMCVWDEGYQQYETKFVDPDTMSGLSNSGEEFFGCGCYSEEANPLAYCRPGDGILVIADSGKGKKSGKDKARGLRSNTGSS
jgi:hypothetical protein